VFSTPTEASHGGTLLLISNEFQCFRRFDLDKFMYSPLKLELTFAEIQLENQP